MAASLRGNEERRAGLAFHPYLGMGSRVICDEGACFHMCSIHTDLYQCSRKTSVEGMKSDGSLIQIPDRLSYTV